MGLLTRPHTQVLKALNRVKHRLQGDPTEITLLAYNATNGQLEPFATIPDTVVKGETPIGMGIWVEEFRLAETDLTLEDAERLGAVDYGGRRYSIGKRVPPNGLQRYWSLQVKPVEPATV